jgi:hypothetical protein
VKRRKDLERLLPRAFKEGGDKARVFQTDDGGLFVVVGAACRSEAELRGIARQGLVMQRAAELLAMPVAGSA